MWFSSNDSTVARPKLVITSDDYEFDQATFRNWRAEGFQISYLPHIGSREEYVQYLQRIVDSLDVGEHFAIIGMLALLRSKQYEILAKAPFLRSLWRCRVSSTRSGREANTEIVCLGCILSRNGPCDFPYWPKCCSPSRWTTKQCPQLSLLLISRR